MGTFTAHRRASPGVAFALAVTLALVLAGGAVPPAGGSCSVPVLGGHLTPQVTEAPAVTRFLTDRFAGRPFHRSC